MAMSRSSRIILLLVIDIVFFFIELIVGELCLYFPYFTLSHRI